jgi:hypothetical protein
MIHMEICIKQKTPQAEVAQACETKTLRVGTVVVMSRRKLASTLFGFRSVATLFSHLQRNQTDM